MKKKKVKPIGRPSKSKSIDVELLKKLYLAGHTDFEIADFMEISPRSLYRYMIETPSFCQSIKAWKEEADNRVERSLYQRAMGYSHESEEIFCAFGKVTRVKTIKHYPPSEVACIFWLKNRKPEQYRDKPPDAEDKDLQNAELVFHSTPKNGDGKEKLKRFFDN